MFAALAHLLAQQQIAGGMIVAAIIGSLLISLKQAPAEVFRWLRNQLTVTLTVQGQDPAYEHLNLWLARDRLARRARQLMLAPTFDYELGLWRWMPTVGRGWHFGWYGGSPLIVHREIDSESGALAKMMGGAQANQRLALTTFGRSQSRLRRLLAEVEHIYSSDGLVRVHFWADGYYRIADRRRPRPMETVFLPEAQKARIAADLDRFLGDRALYESRGAPWRRGYLFEGPPGTGKTSLIFALAGAIERDVYAINLANVTSDNGLMAAFNEVPPAGVVVIEDIDTAEVTRDRQLVEDERRQFALPGGAPAALQASGGRLTLSGLLNAIDGLAAREGRILFVTSNAPEKLDPALVRAGRIDRRERIDLLTREPAFAMYQAYAARPSLDEFERTVAPHLPITGADLQGLLQAHPALELVAEDGRRLA